ncbi:helix-turn-helix domain-containing protein [Natribacillus halophilus]|uniref:Transcriptional regulator, contains XRE-family HTH domain n=1 Tax=Natribacillus halophilus TaxID=549003 RepID=A0A1G8RVC4_9BACI|nr:helix-turn-helix transcriptional regulator [Natribacillus halophilus]SDJ20889.1 Transcriptional regulator, contains XRE-family HTH domain [Natribacillus halophilus]
MLKLLDTMNNAGSMNMSEIIGKRLQSLRKNNGWSKTHVAKKLGIKTMSTYANWEYGTRTPDSETLGKIADIYQVSVDYIIGREDKFKDNERMFAFGGFDDYSDEEIEDALQFAKMDKEKRDMIKKLFDDDEDK